MKRLVIAATIVILVVAGLNILAFYKMDDPVGALPGSTMSEEAGPPAEIDTIPITNELVYPNQYDTVENKMTLLLRPGMVYGYEGTDLTKGKKVNYKTVRPLIQKAVENGWIILIKPAKDGKYLNTAMILDEMNEVNVPNLPSYQVMDITEEEQNFLDQFNQGAP